MPRSRNHTSDSLSDTALKVFWSGGYHATSMDDLVSATGVSRHGIYSDFGGKRELFLACFARYQTLVVTPAFAVVEGPEADLRSVAQYFETQIALAEQAGLPGPGCFVANSATEVAPHDDAVRAKITEHNDRLLAGFRHALLNTAGARSARSADNIDDLALTILIFAQGLWSQSRSTTDGALLRRSVRTFLSTMEGRLE
jgi:TetR/AcrR family transcriptional regulator, transcriptional repressor for nem operon